MATVTPPSRSRNLVESHQRVRHPLQRIRGTIRTYVGLEGAALLLLLLALWFWFTFILDFGVFRVFGWDWVQEVPWTWVRAVSIGTLFLCGVVVLRLGLLRRIYGDEVLAICGTAFATTRKRQTFPVWMRLPVVGALAAVGAWTAPIILRFIVAPETPWFWVILLWAVGGALLLGAGAVAVVLTIRNRNVPEYDRGVFGFAACILGVLIGALLLLGALSGAVFTLIHELSGVRSTVSRWLRAPLAALGCAVGASLGYGIGLHYGVAGTIIGAGFGAMVGDIFALINIGVIAGLVRGQGYLVALTVPCVLAYLVGWLLAGVVAGLIPWLAPILVVLLMVGPVVVIVAARLMHDFADPAIALVLERRFPGVLGDRLITAVELANPKKAARYGYSEAMIEKTIHDAAERVESVPVRDVFDWKRLARYWAGAALLTLGLYAIAGVLFFAPFMGHAAVGEGGGFRAFHTTAGLVLERDLLLRSVTWPRRAYLEVLDWPKNEHREKYVGRDETAFTIKVRAYKWVVADSDTTEGWRPLTWTDLENNPDILGRTIAHNADLFRAETPDGKKDWGKPHDSDMGWTLDEIELRLGREEAHETLDPATHETLRDALFTLKQRTDDPAMRRLVRSLRLPNQVRIRYSGERDSGELTLDREANNEYVGRFPELKESVKFFASGEDYQTPEHKITVRPPPALNELQVEEERPAYTLYRVPGRDPTPLQGRRQKIEGWLVSVTGGDTSRIETVLAGSHMVLTATADKKLKPDSVVIEPPRGGVAPVVQGKVSFIDPYKFQVRFTDLGRFQLTDAALAALREEVPFAVMPKLEALKEKPFNSANEFESQLRVDLAPVLPIKEEFDQVRSKVVDKARPPTSYDFYFRFVDEQGIKGERHIIITPQEDTTPSVEVTVNVLRQKGGVFLVTPQAFLPLEMKIKDDRGLRSVVYACTLEEVDLRKEVSERGIVAAGVMQLLPGGPGQEVAAALRLARLSKEKEKEAGPAPDTARNQTRRFPAGSFVLDGDEFLPLNVLTDEDALNKILNTPRPLQARMTKELLNEHPENESIREIDVRDPKLLPDEQARRIKQEQDRVARAKRGYFEIGLLRDAQGRSLSDEDINGKQRPYVINLWVEALDTDIETGKIKPDDPGSPTDRANKGRNTATLKFKLLSENDLVAEMENQEGAEGGSYDKLDGYLKTLGGARETLSQVLKEWNANPEGDQFDAMIARTERVMQVLANNEGEIRDFSAIYQRLLKECEVNQISDEKKTKTVRDIVTSLETALSGKEWDAKENRQREANGTYPGTRDNLGRLRGELGADGKFVGGEAKAHAAAFDASNQLDALINRLEKVQGNIHKNAGLSHWITKLEDMDRVDLARQQEVLEGIAKMLEDNFDKARDK